MLTDEQQEALRGEVFGLTYKAEATGEKMITDVPWLNQRVKDLEAEVAKLLQELHEVRSGPRMSIDLRPVPHHEDDYPNY